MTHHNDASRESSGAAVDRSRSYPDGTKALTPPSVSRPVDLEAWERLARAATEADKAASAYAQRSWDFTSAEYHTLIDAARTTQSALAQFSTPERILGLIGEVRRSEALAARVRAHIAERTDGDCDSDNVQWDGGFKAACSQIIAVMDSASECGTKTPAGYHSCALPSGHPGRHETATGASWPNTPPIPGRP